MYTTHLWSPQIDPLYTTHLWAPQNDPLYTTHLWAPQIDPLYSWTGAILPLLPQVRQYPQVPPSDRSTVHKDEMSTLYVKPAISNPKL